jgi:signal transduction histidine kinase
VSNLLTSNSVLKIYKDCEQNLWFSSLNGISKTDHSLDLSYWDKNSGLGSNNVLSIIRHQGTIFIATLTKIFFLDKENRVQEVKNLPTGRNAGFIEFHNGKILLAATPEGIFEIGKERATQIYKSGPASTIYQSVKDSSRIFSTTYNNFISFRYQNGKWAYEGMWKGFQEDIRQIMEDDLGDLWIETFSNGIIRVKPDYENITKPKEIQYFKEKEGILSPEKNHLFQFDNKIILGTPFGLLVHNRKSDQFEKFCLPGYQLPGDSCYISNFLQSADGKIWMMITHKGVTDFGYLNPKSGGGYDWVNAPFKRIPDMFLYSFYREKDGVVWFCGSEGLYRYDAAKDIKNYTQKYNCLIRKVMCNGDSLLFGGNGTGFSSPNLKHKHNSLKISYAAPFFDQEERTLYSYKLEGYDSEWSKWESQTEKEYTNLDEGTYKFLAKAKNIYDIESKIDSFQFTIYPPPYRTWWAHALYGVLLFLFIVLIVKAYTRRLTKQKEQLEQVVKERTHEIVLQKEQLQSQTEQLKTQTEQLIITNDKLRELDEFKQGMTSIIVHDLKNPLNLILNTTKKTNPWNQVKVMQESGRQMLDMVLNILDIHKYEETAMILMPENIYLKQIAANAIQQVQFLCDQKDITIVNKIDKDHFIKADKEISGRIFINLLTNAIKYNPINGNILLTSNLTTDTFVHVEVIDSGDGIPEDKLHLVFQKFGQIVAKKSGGVRSTGLGLTFCKMAIEAHGGMIGVNSLEGKGTTFWFTLPCGTRDETQVNVPETDLTLTKESFVFKEDELVLIRPVVIRLSSYTIYETDDVDEILSVLRPCHSENIQKWIAEIEKNMITLNQERYLELLVLT